MLFSNVKIRYRMRVGARFKIHAVFDEKVQILMP